ncbi:hypothetical protein EJ05DRAFT_215594 [Pseudovirgaria hyperparasitica]|uniref:Uncharacterized protein n=1 Tax=Pseudovirgaria hyperparasitica TaxID=470096 RepID=A0A6A6VS71_9PEZI|nr:uncharacterized protein EJ05DRAFT_215594 [Pseudovirgaria hyperparasitica]KAF2753442.1 hypothetical protein EJ05DRAFT_215594 [Pseudovirgaria hyperparasitica]
MPEQQQHPITPSPRRFAPGRDGRQQEDRFLPAGQFARSPRFSLNTRGTSQSLPLSTAPRTGDLPRGSSLKQVLDRRETIEDSSQRSPEHLEDDDSDRFGDEGILTSATIEQSHYGEPSGCLDIDESPKGQDSPKQLKRRRLSDSGNANGPISPNGPMSYRSKRFLHVKPPLFSDQDTSLDDALAAATPTRDRPRPAFLLPVATSADATVPSHPLPDAFSPHRKGQKFIPGGMADTLRSWVVDVASFASESLVDNRTHVPGQPICHPKAIFHASNFVPEDGSKDIGLAAGSWFLAQGDLRDLHGNRSRRKILFAVKTSNRHDVDLRSDTAIVISPPFWEVRIDNEDWLVAVEWSLA